MERHEAFQVFNDLFFPIFYCLEAISHSAATDWNRETRWDAQSFLLAISQFPFIVALVFAQNILGYTKGLSIKLQGWYVDIVRAHQDIESVKTTLKAVRSRVDSFHSLTYHQAVMLGQSVEETALRQALRQQHGQNIPSSSVSEYYKRNLTIPILDHLISELDNRFDVQCSENLLEFMKLLPIEVVNATSLLVPDDFSNVLRVYGSDLPSTSSFDTELDIWQNKWSTSPS